MAARVRHADGVREWGVVEAMATLAPPQWTAQQSRTEIEQIPDKLEFGLVFFCFCFAFFLVVVSLLISFALPAKFAHIFLTDVFFVRFLCCCFCNISTQDFVSNMRWAIKIISTLRFTPTPISNSRLLFFLLHHSPCWSCTLKNDTLQQLYFVFVYSLHLLVLLIPSISTIVQVCELPPPTTIQAWVYKLWVLMWFVVTSNDMGVVNNLMAFCKETSFKKT